MQQYLDFLASCGDPYTHNDELPEILARSIAAGQYVYKPDCYFVAWWNVDDDGLYQMKGWDIPDNITTGKHLYITECGCKRDFREMLQELNKKVGNYKRGFWHRAKGGKHEFFEQ